MRKNDSGRMVRRMLSACRNIFLPAGIFWGVCTFLLACVFLTACAHSYLDARACLPVHSYVHAEENLPVRQAAVEATLPVSILQVWEEEIMEREKEAAWQRAYLYVICNMQEYLADPCHSRSDSEMYNPMDQWVYLGLHDFDGDGIPELLAGDTITMAVFTFAGGRVEKLADLYDPNVACGCIDGVCFKENSVSVSCGSLGGSSLVKFGFRDNNDMKGFATEYFGASGVLPEEAEERIRLVHEESGWILRFQSGEEAVLDSEFNYDLIRW